MSVIVIVLTVIAVGEVILFQVEKWLCLGLGIMHFAVLLML